MNKSPVTARGEWLAICLTALGPTVAALIYIHGPQSTNWVRLIYFSSKMLLFSFPIVWWLYFEKGGDLQAFHSSTNDHPRSHKNHTPKDHTLKFHTLKGVVWRDIAIGIGSGLMIGLTIWTAYWFVFRDIIDAKVLEQKVKEFGAYDYYMIYALFLAVVNSGLEEYYWRWFVFGRLKVKVGLYAATTLSSLAFALHHLVVLKDFLDNNLLAVFISLGIAAGGAIWACHYHRTGRLWGVWVSHFIVDLAALSVGYHLLFGGGN